jgi:hypothetical protein
MYASLAHDQTRYLVALSGRKVAPRGLADYAARVSDSNNRLAADLDQASQTED